MTKILAPGHTTVNTLGNGFNFPTGVAVGPGGNIFVLDTDNNLATLIVR